MRDVNNSFLNIRNKDPRSLFTNRYRAFIKKITKFSLEKIYRSLLQFVIIVLISDD